MKNKKLFAILTLVCFMFTLMPVAAFAAPSVAEDSYVVTSEKDLSIKKGEVEEAIEFDFDGDASDVYVWVEETANVPSTALENVVVVDEDGDVVYEATPSAKTSGVFRVDAAQVGKTLSVEISSTGEYKLHAALYDDAVKNIFLKDSTEMSKVEKVEAIAEYELTSYAGYDTITVKTTATSSNKYLTTVKTDAGLLEDDDKDNFFENGEKIENAVAVDANSVNNETVVVTVYDPDKTTVVKGADVEISTSSNAIEVSDEKLTTNVRGQVEFDVTGTTEGTYYVYVNVDSYEVRIEVQVGAYDAAYIETVKESTAIMSLDSSSLASYVEFEITDINGNVITPDEDENGVDEEITGLAGAQDNEDGDYVKFVTKPADSDLENEDLALEYMDNSPHKSNYGWTIAVAGGFDAEGVYEFKVILDNGKAAYATVTVKEFQAPVTLLLTYKQEAVELDGIAVLDKLKYVDVNGVTKDATDAELAATGYAIEKVYDNGNIKVKADEKYVGSEINVIAVSERYDLTANAVIKVTADAAELKFATDAADVNVNNKIDVQLVDGEGNKVAPTNMSKAEIKYVVLDKPEDAKVNVTTASDSYLANQGVFTMALSSNKVGNVAVQAIAKLTFNNDNEDKVDVVKYYTGTQIFAVGTAGVGDVVVMSIGSNEIVINDAKAVIDAAPIIENNRTFVPFRALAEAFGIKVIPTYDENGATADILFNL